VFLSFKCPEPVALQEKNACATADTSELSGFIQGYPMKLSIWRPIPSILGADCKIDGNIISEGELHILGAFKGNLAARKLMLGKGGTIEGKVEAESVVINGNFSGSLSAKSVVLGQTALVTADIIYLSMEMEAGAVYNGHARHVNDAETNTSEVTELPITERKQIEKVRELRRS